jgi:hypothetical protein
MRNSDLFYDSLEPEPVAVHTRRSAYRTWEERRANGEPTGNPLSGYRGLSDVGERSSKTTMSEPLGLICDPSTGEPLALDVNPAAFSAAHFATFPPKLVEPLIRAGTSEKGCCAACGAPWRRTTQRTASTSQWQTWNGQAANIGKGASRPGGFYDAQAVTTGWAAGCACDAAVVPCTVLDPFAGAGTTLLVADRLQRDAIGIELSDAYSAMADARIADDAPLLAWGAVTEAAE